MTEPKTVTLFGHVLTFSYCFDSGIDMYFPSPRDLNLFAYPPRSNGTEWEVAFSTKDGSQVKATGNSFEEAEVNLAGQIRQQQRKLTTQLHELSVLNLPGQ